MTTENRLVESNIEYIAIPIEEYKKLLEIQHRTTVLKDYMDNTQYPDDGTIMMILGYKGRGLE